MTAMYQLIASPFIGDYLVVRPGQQAGVKIPRRNYLELRDAAATGAEPPQWFADVARKAWGLDLESKRVAETTIVRDQSPYSFGRASYELNLGCNYDCEHCYLGLKTFSGLDWEQRARLLHTMHNAGVLWLQLTGGEPLIDKLFTETYTLAYDLGMMLHISSNASRLHHQPILDLLTIRRPYRITVSVYGATEASYDGLVRRRGAFKLFERGMAAALEAGLPMRLNIVLTKTNAHEETAMIAMAERWGLEYLVYSNLSPTIYGGAEVLPAQSVKHLRARKPFTGCNAGHTFFHVDPHGKASICKVGRDSQIDLPTEGVDGLRRLGAIADSLMLRTGGCSGCQLSGSCTVCRPLAKLYQEAKAPLNTYCQHGRRSST
jgi:MoaA/NifB/PqqE/SkfB family radical SAM enzyme